jgi:riboflavin kinase/FMN adenylyltransferase
MRPVSLAGKVIKFNGLGRQLGYPTANISVATNLEEGVYFGLAELAEYKDQPSLIFIGAPITFNDSRHRVEAHLLDVEDQDYYGQTLKVSIMYFHRANQKFKDGQELMDAMKADEETARAWFKTKGLLS